MRGLGKKLGLKTKLALAVALLPVMAPIGSSVASAASSAPPFEPDADAASYGSVTFYDSSGNQVTSGTDLTAPFAYAVAVTGPDQGATKSYLYYAQATPGEPPSGWSSQNEAGPTTFSPASSLPAGTPADVAAYAPSHPVVATPSDSIIDFASNFPSQGTITGGVSDGYADTIQVRITDSGARGAGTPSGKYWESDIAYNTSGSSVDVDGVTIAPGTWAQVFPVVNSPESISDVTTSPASPQSAGTPITLKADVTPATDAGSVMFFDNGQEVGSPQAVQSGTTTYTQSDTPTTAGTHTLTASFVPTLGDVANGGTNSATVVAGATSPTPTSYTITSATTTSISAGPNPGGTGQRVTYTATVSPAPDGGTVAFDDGAGNPAATDCPAQSVDTTTGVATCTVTYSSPGQLTVNASYSGNTDFGASATTTAATETIKTGTTTAIVSTTGSPTTVGQSVTYTATVVPTPDGGSVAFNDGAGNPATTDCASEVVDTTSGTATCTVVYNKAASYTVNATYGGDTTFAGSTSATPTSQTVKADDTTTALTSSANPSVTGQSVTYTASVTPTPDGGTVAFSDTAGPIPGCSAKAVNTSTGSATCTVAPSVAGSDSISARYSGDGNYNSSTTSTPLSQAVQMAATSVIVTSSPTTAYTGQSVTYTATVSVTAPGAGSPTGSVSLSDGAGNPATTKCNVVNLSGGTATCTVTYCTASAYTVMAVYSGDQNFRGSTSSNYSETIHTATAPTAPTLSKATPGDGQVTLTWTAPSSDGHSTIQGYNVFEGTAAGGESATPVNSSLISGTTYTVKGLTNKMQYFFTVKAVNAVGPSPASNELSATPSQAAGYWLVGSDGGLFGFGGAPFYGSLGNHHLVAPIVGMAHTPDRSGYWLVAADGGVFNYGTAKFYGSLGGIHLVAPIVTIVPTPSGDGYWLIASDGGVFGFGDARFHGSLGAVHLVKPIIGAIATSTGDGYYLVASDGGVFAFGDAKFAGSLGNIKLVAPIVGIAPAPDGVGYILAAADGGIFAFGHGVFHGSLGGVHLVRPIVGIVPTPGGGGYWLIGNDGGIFAFGNAGYRGSLPALHAYVSNIVGGA